MPTRDVTIKFPAVPFRQTTFCIHRRGVDTSLDLGQESIDARLVAICCCGLNAHFLRPRTDWYDSWASHGYGRPLGTACGGMPIRLRAFTASARWAACQDRQHSLWSHA